MLTAFLFFARALISGAFQGIYVYTPEVRGYDMQSCVFYAPAHVQMYIL